MSALMEVIRMYEVIEVKIDRPSVIQMPQSLGGNILYDPTIQIAKACNEFGLKGKVIMKMTIEDVTMADPQYLRVRFEVENKRRRKHAEG